MTKLHRLHIEYSELYSREKLKKLGNVNAMHAEH